MNVEDQSLRGPIVTQPATPSNPLRVAIVGSGPAAFYVVSNILKHPDLTVEIDMFERLPTPFGLVRAGVAPDHQKDKTVTRAYDRSAAHATFRFFGNVEYGKHVHLQDLMQHYHQVVFATGAQSDRSLGIPGEDLAGSHPATDFVAWYNGHPDYADYHFDLSGETAVIIGLGNVAIDVARILCKRPEELAQTDIADHALEALQQSRIHTVYLLGRRGPAQAAFTPAEIQEMGDLDNTDVVVDARDAALDPVSQRLLDAEGDKNAQKNVAIIREFSSWQARGRDKQLNIRFFASPLELMGDQAGHVREMRIVKNEPYEDDAGTLRARATDQEETLPADIVFRSVGYRGVPLAGVPFDERAGICPNEVGRVLDENGAPVPGIYVAGWIKRGPSGVIGTNKTDAKETVDAMVEDMQAGRTFNPQDASAEGMLQLLAERQPDIVTYKDWRHIDEIELERGAASGRPRVKFTSVSDMLDVLER